MAKDRELRDHERAHTGKPGAKVRHGQDALKKITTKPKFGHQESEEELRISMQTPQEMAAIGDRWRKEDNK